MRPIIVNREDIMYILNNLCKLSNEIEFWEWIHIWYWDKKHKILNKIIDILDRLKNWYGKQ